MQLKWLPVYFLVGGSLVATISYLGTHGHGFVAAIVAFFPSMSLFTMATIFANSGQAATISYAKSMLVLLPAWALYVVAIIILLPRIGPVWSLMIGTGAYMVAALLTKFLAAGVV